MDRLPSAHSMESPEHVVVPAIQSISRHDRERRTRPPELRDRSPEQIEEQEATDEHNLRSVQVLEGGFGRPHSTRNPVGEELADEISKEVDDLQKQVDGYEDLAEDVASEVEEYQRQNPTT